MNVADQSTRVPPQKQVDMERSVSRWLIITTLVILIIYALPLFGFVAAAFITAGFEIPGNAPRFLGVTAFAEFASTYQTSVYTPLGAMIVPLLAVFAVQITRPGERIPWPTLGLLGLIIFLVLISAASLSMINAYSGEIKLYNIKDEDGKVVTDVFTIFKTITTSYLRDSLSYLALTLGLAYKKT